MAGIPSQGNTFRSMVLMAIAMALSMISTAIPLFGDGGLKAARTIALIGMGILFLVFVREAFRNRPR